MNFLGEWIDQPVNSITAQMVRNKHLELKARGPRHADLIMGILGSIIKFAHACEALKTSQPMPINPVSVLTVLSQRSKAKTNIDEYIKDEELGRWILAVKQLENKTATDYLLFVLLTGMRRTEASYLTWDKIDLSNGVLCLPKEQTKNGVPLRLPLSSYLIQMLRERKHASQNEYVFPSRYNNRGNFISPERSINQVRRVSGIFFKMHMIRRTFINLASHPDVGADEMTLKALVNHVAGDVTYRHYLTVHTDRIRPVMQKISDLAMSKYNKLVMDLDD
jgi:integrase